MNLIRKKQIEGLENDILSSKIGSDIFTRNTSFSLGSPGVAEAHLDGDTAGQITTLHINVSDDIGNRYSMLNEYVQYDTLIITSESGNISKYLINSIEAAVDVNNEGHFILTLQHSFGYNGTFEHSSLNYYFRKSAAVDLIENERVRAITAENSIKNLVYATAQSLEDTRYVCEYQFSAGVPLTVPHTLDSNCVMVQIINSSTGVLCTDTCTVSNYQQNSIDIDVPETGTYKVLLITVGNFESSYVPPEPPEPPEEYTQTHIMEILGGNHSTGPDIQYINFSNFFSDGTTANNEFNFSPAPYNVEGDKYAVCTISWWQKLNFDPTVEQTYRGIFDFASQYNTVQFNYSHPNMSNILLTLFSTSRSWKVAGAGAEVDVSDGSWHHYCLLIPDTTTNATARLFIDNTELTGSGGGGHIYAFPMERIQIATSYRPTESYFSNVQVFNSILSDAEIETLWNNGKPLPTTIADSNLKLWAKLDNDGTFSNNWSIPDSSGNGNTGTSTGMDGTELIEEVVQAAIQTHVMNFDGSNDWIDAPKISPTNGITISAWINTTTTSGTRVIVCEDRFSTTPQRDWAFYLDADNNLRFYAFNPDESGDFSVGIAKPAASITDGNWHHVCVTWDGTITTDAAKIVFDGTDITQATATATGIKNTSPYGLAIGQTQQGGGYRFNGKMSNVQIWDASITTSQIAELYNNGVPLTTAIASDSLRAWYKLSSNEVFNGTNWEIENQKYPAGFNSALRFTTTAGITANSPIISNSMTHSTSWWAKYDGYATREDLLLTTSALSGYLMYVNNGGLISFRPTIDTTTNTSSPNGTYKAITNGNTGKWYHYVFIRDGGNVKLYENNIKVWDAAMADGTENVPTELIQGFASKQSYAGSTSNYSNFSFFNTAINESDVQTLYNNGTPLTDVSSITSMNNWYKLDNLALGLEDSIGGNNATATGTVDEINTLVSTNIAVSSGMDESNLIEEEI